MIPVMAEVVRLNPKYQFVVAAVKTLPEELYAPLREIASVKFVYESTYDLLTHSRAAIVTSGTAALETGLFKVPQAVIYKAGGLEFLLLKRLVKIPYISLTNLIANRLVFKEFIQDEMNAQNLNNELAQLAEDTPSRKKMLEDYEEVYKTLDTGSASDNAARLMWGYLQQY
jgi:lipid-A-disaccharide synthase